jgi:hypothetical protein
MSEDEQIDLVALMRLGRGDGDIEEWDELRRQAAEGANGRTAHGPADVRPPDGAANGRAANGTPDICAAHGTTNGRATHGSANAAASRSSVRRSVTVSHRTKRADAANHCGPWAKRRP